MPSMSTRRGSAPQRSERLQVFHQVLSLLWRKLQVETRVVAVHYVQQRRKPSVMVEAAFGPGEESAQRRGAVALVGRAIGLEIVNPDFRGRVHVPTRFCVKWRHMTGGAVGLALEQRLAAGGGGGVKAAARRLGNREGQLIKLQRCQLAGDQVIVGLDIREA